MEEALNRGDLKSFLEKASSLLSQTPKAAILIGTAGAERGIAFTLAESQSEKPILDGWFIDLYKGKRIRTKEDTLGVGIGKIIVDSGPIKLGAGAYITKPLVDFLDREALKNTSRLNFAVGISGSIKF